MNTEKECQWGRRKAGECVAKEVKIGEAVNKERVVHHIKLY